ncbi:hypothetical protein TSTA_099410 [Talaromyces stipitatus ATCC 10500]|uniref:Uncharacterized protein n=1 Tax=Talaromyces stipitatus (strain ATCC 10500 / CBS 375.48 / QM 6759 / NRRL 1006) TaxID=441959 RepID=B8MMD5_TALSN|nr:uncharacterized protein TSTA_099410 [Talaromyces stipitatus ATCC 10500]EED13689.1 hypothetical protein TSTA_099410 [Talaromyces stipitatus ATCC 10500]
MGTIPSEAAPAYEDLFAGNTSGTKSIYISINMANPKEKKKETDTSTAQPATASSNAKNDAQISGIAAQCSL